MNLPKVAGVVAYASLFFLLLLVATPFNFAREIITSKSDWTLIMIVLYLIIAVIVLALGTNFAMFNSVKIRPRRGEWLFAASLASIIWYLFFIYVYTGYFSFLNLPMNSFYSMLIFVVIAWVTIAVSYFMSSRGIGIALIVPYSVIAFADLFLYTWTRFGTEFGYLIGIVLVVLEGVVLGVLITEKKRQWANFILSTIFLASVFYGILKEGTYYHSSTFYIWSLTVLILSAVMVSLFYIKPTHLPFSGSFRFGKNKTSGRLLLVLVTILFLVGFYLIIPNVTVTASYYLMGLAFALLFAGALFFFMNFQSSTRATDLITYILISGVALYGLRYLIDISPSFIIGGTIPKTPFWFVLAVLIMYEPSFTIVNHASGNRLNPNFSIAYLLERWRRRSKLLNGRYDISQNPFKKTGGNANIYEAYDVRERKDVIIKIPVILCKKCNHREETIPINGKCPKCGTSLDVRDFYESMKVLKDEINALSSLDSEHIVRQLDHFDWGGKTYLVEERVSGSSFREVFVGNPIDEKKTLELIKETLHGINHAHMHGIIHRDLNTGNLMLTGNNEVKIIDFGTAKFKSKASLSKGKPSVASKFGTDYFSPPESYYIGLIPNREPAFSYDVYSTGCIMYVMLVGDYPPTLDPTTVKSIYPNNTFREDFAKQLSSKCSKDVLSIMLKATSYFPENRYQSAFEMLCAIEHLSGDFIVTSNEQAFSFPSPIVQTFSSEIVLDYRRQHLSKRSPSFSEIKKAINMEAHISSSRKQPTKYNLTYDKNLNQYKLAPGRSKLYLWYLDKDNKLIIRQVAESGVYLGREIMLFSPTNSLANVVFAYYRV